MPGPYRKMPDVLGEGERGEAAIQEFGRWRNRTTTSILLAFALVGLAPAGFGYWLAQELQFRSSGVALLTVNVAGAVLPWIATFVVGAVVGRRFVVARTPAKLARLAADYEIPIDDLAATANLVHTL